MSHRRSTAAVAAASKASWDTADTLENHYGDRNGFPSGEDVATTSDIFKQRRAIGRHSVLRTKGAALRQNRHNVANCVGNVVESKKIRGPPTLLERPRSSTGFEDYFADADASAKLRLLKTNPSLQDLKRMTLRDRNQKNLATSPREKRCVSAQEKKDLDGKQVETHVQNELNEKNLLRSERTVYGRSKYNKSNPADRVERNKYKDIASSSGSGKIKAFHALVGSGFDSPMDATSQRDISNEQLKRVRSFSSLVEEVGGYLKFSSQSSEKSGMRSSTPVNNEDEDRNDFDGSILAKECSFNRTLNLGQAAEQSDRKHIDQRNDLPLSFKRGDMGRFYQSPGELYSNRLYRHEFNESRKGHPNDYLFSSKAPISNTYSQSNESSLTNNERKTMEKTGENSLVSYRNRRDTKRIMRRSYGRKKETDTEIEGQKFEQEADAFSARAIPEAGDRDSALVDKEVHEYMDQANEHPQRRDVNLYTTRDQRTHSAVEEMHRYGKVEPRPSSSQEILAKPRNSGTISHGSLVRPLTATGLPEPSHPNNSSLDYSAATSTGCAKHSGKTMSNVGPITKSNEQYKVNEKDVGRYAEIADGFPGKEASLQTHLNFLGASLTSLSSRLTSSSESDLKSHKHGRSSGAGEFMTPVTQDVKSTCASSGTGRASELMSFDSSTSSPRRQSGGARMESPFDIAHVRISVGENGLNLQTWASSSSLVLGSGSDSINIDARGCHHVGHSSPTVVKGENNDLSDTSSCEIGSPHEGKQTNVKVIRRVGSLRSRSSSSIVKSPRDIILWDWRKNTESTFDYISKEKTKRNISEMPTKNIENQEDQDTTLFSCNYQKHNPSRDLESTYQNSDSSLDDTLVSHGATEDLANPPRKHLTPNYHGDHGGGVGKPARPKIISRKNPLKAVHPSFPDSADLKDDDVNRDFSKDRRSNKLQHSPERTGRAKEKHILVKRPAMGRQEQGSQKKHGVGNSDMKDSSRVSSLTASVNSLGASRSKTSLGLFSSSKPGFDSPLPSKAKMKDITEKLRPQTFLAIPSNQTKRDRDIHSKSKKAESEIDDSGQSRSALLKQKVQKLHEDITRRLQSKANSSYCINSSYDHRESTEDKHRKISRKGCGSDESDSRISEASTIHKVDRPYSIGLQQSPRSAHRRRSPGLHSNISSPLSSPKPGFTTSTPVKGSVPSYTMEVNEPDSETKRRLLRQVARELSKEKLNSEIEKELDTAQKYNYGRFTPEAADYVDSPRRSPKLTRLLKIHSQEGESESDDEDKETKEADGRKSHFGLRRSGSTGSLLKTKVKPKGDFMSRILDKMSGLSGGQHRQERGAAHVDQPMTRFSGSTGMYADTDNRISGRTSPADILLGHLDNPQMVKLLQRLYKADPETRKILMVKFQYFKAWECYAKETKEKRIRKEELSSKGESHLRCRLLCLHFVTWWRRASHCAQVRRADALLRRHTLIKGMKALRWSLSQSRHTAARIQSNVRSAAVRRDFAKWKARAVRNRLERKQAALARWKQFVTETKKVRQMRQLMDFNLQQEVIRRWHKNYRKRVKLNMAFHFFRHTLSQKVLGLWKLYVSQCKLAQEKLSSAVAKHQKTLLNTAFYSMLVSYKKVKKSKAHFRAFKLSETLWAWREAAQVCRTERLRDMATSTEHWRYTQLRQRFSHWREALQVRRLLRVSQAHLCRSAFSIWCVAWQKNIERREAIEVALTQNKLRGALLSWRQNVVRLRMRQKKAVIILEHCHLKQTFKCWRLYTAWKGILKKKVLIRNIEKSKDILFSSFMVWKEAFSHRREQEKTKQLWSTDCARKYAAFWRLTCHKRQLYRLNQGVLRPVRENRILRSAFAHWVSSLECRHVESERADEMWERLKRSRLQFCFLVWQGETSRALLLKPLQRRLEQKILSESLSAWRSYVVGKTRCRANFELFRKKVLKSSFESWRRQHHACLVAKQAAACASQGLLLSFLEAWRFLIERKRKSREFRKCKLTRLMFLSWRGRASFEMDRRARLEEEEASNQMLKHRCFHLWRDNSRALVDDKERKVVDFLRRQSESSLGRAFLDWRRHMHSTLVSRAYNKSLADRLVATLFWEWRDVTSCIVLDAVHAFSERIGLRDHVMEGHVAESTVRVTEEQDSDEAMIRSVDSVSFSLGSSARGLYGEAASGFDTDTDRMILLSGGLQASVNEYQLRCQRLKEMALLAIIRLKNWPVCLAFEQWREFTGRERQLKRAAAQLRTRVATLEEALVLRKWRENYDGASLARKHRTHYLTATMFESLRAYKNHRKYLKNLKKLAQAHRMLVSGRKYFYPWLMRTQEQRKQKHILHLWSSRTAEEMQLLPLETQLTNQITRRSLIVCFTIWSVRYRAVTCIRAVVYKSLLSWVFTAWRNWAKTKHDRGSQCKVFQERTQTKLAFSRWRERLCQSREVARKHQLAWKSYLLLILQQWRIWAAASKQLAMVEQEVTIKLCRRHLEASFERWRSMAVKVRSARSSMTQRLTYTLFGTWRRETIRRREEKSHVLQCQVRSYTLLVERLFLQWRAAFQAGVLERQERQLQAEEQARVWGRVWRQQAQKSRGLWLQGQLDKRKMAAAFSIWSLRLSRVHELNSLLQTSQRERDAKLLLRSVQTWRLQVSSAQAVRLQAARLTLTVLAEWRAFTKERRDRRIRGMALKKALQERSLHVYFSYWLAVTHTSQSIQQSVEKRILFRVLRAWRDQASSQKYLRSLYSHFRLRLETRMLQNVFQTLRCKADYCAGLQEIVLAIVRDKERATLKAVITVWRDRLDNILATRFYVHILTVRTARQWHRFVVRRHLQRQRDAQNEALATHHHGLSLCRKVFNSLKTEVVVSRHVQTRRVLLCHKYARLWQSRVDHAVTARTMEREFSIRKAWVVWRLAYSRRCVIYKVLAEENRHILRLIFKEWRRTYSKKFALPNMASSSYDSYLRPVTYFSTSSSQSSSSSATMSPSLLPVPSSQKRSSICAPSSPSSAAETSFGFRGGSGRRKQN